MICTQCFCLKKQNSEHREYDEGDHLLNFKWPYQANVIKMFESTSNKIVEIPLTIIQYQLFIFHSSLFTLPHPSLLRLNLSGCRAMISR